MQREYNADVNKSLASIDKDALDFDCQKHRVVRQVETLYRDRAYKMLVVASPSNGNAFLQLIYNYNWTQKGCIAKDKVVILGQSHLSPER